MPTLVIVAIVGALGAIGGALANGLLGRFLEHRRRYERRRDIVTALHAEITASLRGATLQSTPEERRYALDNESPFGVPDETDFVFDLVFADLSEVAILPSEAIYPLVAYHKLAKQSNLYTGALKDAAFRAQTREEKRKHVEQLLALNDEQIRAGRIARDALEEFGDRRRLVRRPLGLKAKRTKLEDVWSGQRADRSGHAISPPSDIEASGRD